MKYNKFSKNKTQNDDNNVFWVTMSDLMLGVAVIFIVLFVFAITGFTQNKINQHNMQYQINEKLIQELNKKNINAEIDKISGIVKISDLELFELNSWQLSKKGEEYLQKFIPVYLNTILNDKETFDNIQQISIEGHTDSQAFKNTKTEEEQYLKNLNLSLNRAEAIANYIIKLNAQNNNNYNEKLTKLLSVEGKSFSKPIVINGKEDFNKSRRVELKIIFKEKNLLNLIKK